MNRREFVATAVAAALPPGVRRAPSRLGPLGVQLYTVRRLMQRDFEGTLRQVAEIGYREVEFAGYFNRTPEQVRDTLARYGLRSPGAHLDFALLENGWSAALDAARTIGQEYVLMAWVPEERRRTLDDWRRIGGLFNRAAEAARGAGLQFAYHNHSYEFAADAQQPYDVLLEATDPALVKLEMDLYWITAAGRNPLDYFRRWPGRFPLVHVKDRTAEGRMADVGAGAIDWRAIFAQREQAGIRHYLVEHDEPADPLDSIRASYAYLSRLEV